MNARRIIPIVALIVGLAAPTAVRAADGGRLRLTTSDSKPAVGQVFIVDVLVENAPAIYGADVQLAFDPAVLEVVDSDASVAGVQLKPGPFIDAQKSFFLQQSADNQKGTVDYALVLLNPAPAVNGDGMLVQVAFRAKAEGRSEISITEGMYGTRTGETVSPSTDRIEINATIGGGSIRNPLPGPMQQLLTAKDAAGKSGGLVSALLVLGLASGLGCVALLGTWFDRKLHRRRK